MSVEFTTTTDSQNVSNEVRAELRAELEARQRNIITLIAGHSNETELLEVGDNKFSVANLRQQLKGIEEQLHVFKLEDEQSSADYGVNNTARFVNAMGGEVVRPANKPNRKLLDSPDAMQEMFGARGLAQLTPTQRAQCAVLRESDVEGVNLSEYFGRGSSATKASELHRQNLPLYKTLQQRARQTNLI